MLKGAADVEKGKLDVDPPAGSLSKGTAWVEKAKPDADLLAQSTSLITAEYQQGGDDIDCTEGEKKIVVKFAGWTFGMTKDALEKQTASIIQFYKPIKDKIYAFTWDGDLKKKEGSDLDKERETPACFTDTLVELKAAFPNVPF